MHILLIPSWYKTVKEPFMGTFFEEQARALIRLGHQVGILYPEYSPLSNFFGIKDVNNEFYDDNGLPTYTINVQSKIPRLRKLSYWSFGKTVNKIFEEYISKYGTPDVIHAHSIFFGGIAAKFIAKQHNLPLVITEHLTAYIMGTINNKEDRRLATEIFTHADSALIVSNNFRNDLSKELSLNPNTFKVVNNMVADLFFEDFMPKNLLPGEEFIFFTNSFLLPRKNHKLLLESLKLLIDKNLNVRLRVGGDGPLRNELKNFTIELGIENKVDFIGGINRLQVKKELVQCHSFILASFYETFGVVLIESLACGRPVIVTDSGGPADFINESNGIIVADFSANKFAESMEKMMNNYANYNQQSISKNCFNNFNEKHIAHQLENEYKNVIAKRNILHPVQ